MMKRISLLNIFSNPWLLGLILFLAVFYFVSGIFPSYSLRLVDWEFHPPYEATIFHDLNGDGISEDILIDFLRQDFFSVMISQEGKILDQFKLDGKMVGYSHYCLGDANKNNLKEIYLLSIINDSVTLVWFEPYDTGKVIHYKTLERATKIKEELTTGYRNPMITDLDGDGTQEFLCIINTGYGVYPRCLLMYDFDKDVIYKSPASCVALVNYEPFDLNGDGKMEIIVTANHAHGNCTEDSIPNDQHTWLMVLDHRLEWFFQPVPVGDDPSYLEMTAFDSHEGIRLLAISHYRGMSQGESMIIKADINGRIISSRPLTQPEHKNRIRIFRMMEYDYPLYMESNGKIGYFESDLTMNKIAQTEDLFDEIFFYEDLDGDGSMELLMISTLERGFLILDADFRKIVEFKDRDINLIENFYFSLIKHPQQKQRFALNTNYEGLFIFEYSKNPLHFLKHITFILIYLGFVAIIYLIGRIQRQRLIQEYNRKRRMSELQVLSIQKQISPHFTLNILNSIGGLIYHNDKEKVQTLLGKYSKIIRYSLMSSDNIAVTLSEELEQVSNYLFLERFRMDRKFDYEIAVDEQTDREYRIPKTLLFTFTENAVKHGIRPLEDSGGMIRIKIKQAGKQIIIRITDNGIGRERAASQPSLSTGKGIRIMDEILRIYSDLEKVRIRYWIEDLDPGNINPGTKVKIIVPLKY